MSWYMYSKELKLSRECKRKCFGKSGDSHSSLSKPFHECGLVSEAQGVSHEVSQPASRCLLLLRFRRCSVCPTQAVSSRPFCFNIFPLLEQWLVT
jgi:hypothetical protein